MMTIIYKRNWKPQLTRKKIHRSNQKKNLSIKIARTGIHFLNIFATLLLDPKLRALREGKVSLSTQASQQIMEILMIAKCCIEEKANK